MASAIGPSNGPVILVGEVSGESGAVEFLLESGAPAVRVA